MRLYGKVYRVGPEDNDPRRVRVGLSGGHGTAQAWTGSLVMATDQVPDELRTYGALVVLSLETETMDDQAREG